ncbi:hypothetical protein RND81_10G035500 [Saponaria officinalis]|uniref:CCHC-type domain-containing protein n=1 Tax=Saponaria officinalis TaxID=3572 RepID=A0AAW1HY43_SAPOF
MTMADHANHAGQQQQQQQPQPQQQQTIFEKFVRNHPPTYDGVCNPVLLEAWIREMEKLFIATQCPEDQKVGIATYYLQKEADNWWAISRAVIQAEPNFGWARFCEALKKRFYPEELRWQKEREFLQLESIVAGIPSATFQQVYDRALSVYASVKAEETETANRGFKRPFVPPSSYQGAKRPKFVLRQIPSGGRPSGPPNMVCMRCCKPYHPGKNCDGTPMLCYKCKEPGHKAYECTKNSLVQKVPTASVVSAFRRRLCADVDVGVAIGTLIFSVG